MLGGLKHRENQYFLSDRNSLCSDGYPGKRVTDEHLCRNAAVFFNKRFIGRKNHYEAPTGCVTTVVCTTGCAAVLDVMFLNIHPRGLRHPRVSQVCKKTGMEKINYLF